MLRDAEVHTLTQEIIQLRVGPYMRAYREVLSPGLGLEGRAMLGLMLSVHAWHTLVRDNDVALGVAIELAVGAIEHAGEPPARAAAVADASPPPH